MSIVFTIYYKSDTGDIVSYQDGGAIPPDNEIPTGCGRLCMDGRVTITDPKSHRVNARIDTKTLAIIPFDAPRILTVNPPSAEMPIQAKAISDV